MEEPEPVLFQSEDGLEVNLSTVVARSAASFGRKVSQILFTKEELMAFMISPDKVATRVTGAEPQTPSPSTSKIRPPLSGHRVLLFKGIYLIAYVICCYINFNNVTI